MVDAEQARIEAAKKGGGELPSIVPRSWELVKIERGGAANDYNDEPEVLAKGVIAFALSEDGNILYSNGSALFRLDASGKSEAIEKRKDIQEIVVL